MTVYVITLEGEPQVVYKDIDKVRQECYEWMDKHYNDYYISKSYYYWLEDRDYPIGSFTNDIDEPAWEDYKESVFEEGTWGDYAWHECYLK